MGKIKNGLTGIVTGSVGNHTYYELNGQNIARLKPRGKRTKRSEKQLSNEQRMAVINHFFRSINPFLKVGFELEAKGTTSNYHNKATSYNKVNAIKGEYPNFEIDYEKVLLSKGDLDPALNPSIEILADSIRFNWEVTPKSWEYNSAQVMMMAYFPEANQSYSIDYGAPRRAGTDILPIGIDLKGQTMEVYVSFVSADRNCIANSTYLGSYLFP